MVIDYLLIMVIFNFTDIYLLMRFINLDLVYKPEKQTTFNDIKDILLREYKEWI